MPPAELKPMLDEEEGTRSSPGWSDARQRQSRPLSPPELKELYNARGLLPEIKFVNHATTIEEVRTRVEQLNQELKERVQEICDRLSAERRPPSVCRQCMDAICRRMKLGVVNDVLPHICVYILYSLGVSYYASTQGWDLRWSASKQDAIYYPAMVLAFLLCFRASGCMDRYKEGLRTTNEMEKCLRETVFDVMTKLSENEDRESGKDGSADEESVLRALRKQYFKHEFRRLVRLLFACAARDLNDSALEDRELSEEEAERIPFIMTRVEHSAASITHSAFGHVFRVFMAASWLVKLVSTAVEIELFEDKELHRLVESRMSSFKAAWLDARQVAYTSMPGSVMHILWLLTTVMSLFMPWEWVTVCQWHTWFPSVLLTVSFYGVMETANSMENPFGFDDDDIQIWEIADRLDEEICLTMYYSVVADLFGENLYRSINNDCVVRLVDDRVGKSRL